MKQMGAVTESTAGQSEVHASPRGRNEKANGRSTRLLRKNHDNKSGDLEMVLSHQVLHNCAVTGVADKVFGIDWIAHAETNRAWRNIVSVLLIVLFILHAPVSQRFVYYFACHSIDKEKSYLRSDYRQCYTGKHWEFAGFAVFMIVFFTFLLPLTILGQLC